MIPVLYAVEGASAHEVVALAMFNDRLAFKQSQLREAYQFPLYKPVTESYRLRYTHLRGDSDIAAFPKLITFSSPRSFADAKAAVPKKYRHVAHDTEYSVVKTYEITSEQERILGHQQGAGVETTVLYGP